MPLLSNAARKLANDSLIYAALGGIAAACLTIADFVLFREPCDTQSLIDSIHNVELERFVHDFKKYMVFVLVPMIVLILELMVSNTFLAIIISTFPLTNKTQDIKVLL